MLRRLALLACTVVVAAPFTTACGGDSGASFTDDMWAEEDGFNPDDEDYSNEASDLDCSEVDGPVEIDPDDDVNNLDRDGDGVACEWS